MNKMPKPATTVAGYLVRIVDDETCVKDVLYKKHVIYTTFEDALVAAKRLGDDEVVHCHAVLHVEHNEKSQGECEKYGYTTVYEIRNEDYNSTISVMVFALYVAT